MRAQHQLFPFNQARFWAKVETKTWPKLLTHVKIFFLSILIVSYSYRVGSRVSRMCHLLETSSLFLCPLPSFYTSPRPSRSARCVDRLPNFNKAPTTDVKSSVIKVSQKTIFHRRTPNLRFLSLIDLIERTP